MDLSIVLYFSVNSDLPLDILTSDKISPYPLKLHLIIPIYLRSYLAIWIFFFHSDKDMPVLAKMALFKEFNEPKPQLSANNSLVYSGYSSMTFSSSLIR